mgnify:CR=1 FL=1
MGLDSVEIVMCWEDTFGITLDDSEVANLQTPNQAIDLISSKLGAIDARSFCPTLRAFRVFRSCVRGLINDSSRRIRLSDPLRSLQGKRRKKDFWREFEVASEIMGFRPPQLLFRQATVRDTVELLVARHLKQLFKPTEVWTKSLVRFGVRYGVMNVVGTRIFSDDDRFIEDIGID